MYIYFYKICNLLIPVNYCEKADRTKCSSPSGWGMTHTRLTCLSQPQTMLPMDRPMPLYPCIMFDSSLEAAATEMRWLFLSL